ncbi:MAG TPA: hypothetical protein PKD20_03425 [Candidatus Saccharibacteria bacterium]|jgi:hypothetical protein|nr:hypothetical protein [Candidatus Saccharibacteria bacterium]HMT55902.1 hypothetical protein [Candidatus Saccharibacteria bacterium]
MSELAPKPHQNESLPSPETAREQLESIREKIDSDAEKATDHKLDQGEIARRVEQHAISGKERSAAEHQRPKHHPVLINKQLKDMAYSRTMTRVRKRLPLPSRAFSKVIHSKVVDKPSEFVGKTVARPSSMLGGAFFAAFGSCVLLWITKRYGYEYNYLAILLMFIAGMALGLTAEIIYRTAKRRS